MKQSILDNQNHETDITARLITWSKFHGGLILDIGASLGFFAKNILEYYPNSKVVCIEPSVINFEHLVNNTSGKNVLPIMGAVTNGDKKVIFYENYNPNQGSIFMSNYLKCWNHTIEKNYEVVGYDFKNLINTLQPNLIKIDIEGYEFFLDYTNLPESVNTIIFEIHMSDVTIEGKPISNIIDNDLEVYTKILETLKFQGFKFISAEGFGIHWDGKWDGSNNTHMACLTR